MNTRPMCIEQEHIAVVHIPINTRALLCQGRAPVVRNNQMGEPPGGLSLKVTPAFGRLGSASIKQEQMADCVSLVLVIHLCWKTEARNLSFSLNFFIPSSFWAGSEKCKCLMILGEINEGHSQDSNLNLCDLDPFQKSSLLQKKWICLGNSCLEPRRI